MSATPRKLSWLFSCFSSATNSHSQTVPLEPCISLSRFWRSMLWGIGVGSKIRKICKKFSHLLVFNNISHHNEKDTHTTLLKNLWSGAKHFVVNSNSSRGVMRSVQTLIFADLSKDLGRAHWVAPFVESKSLGRRKQYRLVLNCVSVIDDITSVSPNFYVTETNFCPHSRAQRELNIGQLKGSLIKYWGRGGKGDNCGGLGPHSAGVPIFAAVSVSEQLAPTRPPKTVDWQVKVNVGLGVG